MDRVLIISQEFPPSPSVGGFRAAYFTKYLPRYGWECFVLTTPSSYRDQESSFSECLDMAKNISRVEAITNDSMSDAGVGWIPKLTREAQNIINNYEIDVVLHTSGPFLPLLSSVLITKLSGVNHIVDLRDPWTLRMDLSTPSGMLSRGYRCLSQQLEPMIFKRTDKIVMNTNVMEKMYLEKHGFLQGKTVVINNGYDKKICRNNKASGYKIIYPGKFYGDIQRLFVSLSKFFEANRKAKLIHFGDASKYMVELAEELNISENIEFRGMVNKNQISDELQCADLGLVIARDVTHIPMKVYDYISADLPILGVGPEKGALSELLSTFEGGYLTDQAGFVDTAKRVYKNNNKSLGTRSEIEKYSYDKLTKKLSDELAEVVTND